MSKDGKTWADQTMSGLLSCIGRYYSFYPAIFKVVYHCTVLVFSIGTQKTLFIFCKSSSLFRTHLLFKPYIILQSVLKTMKLKIIDDSSKCYRTINLKETCLDYLHPTVLAALSLFFILKRHYWANLSPGWFRLAGIWILRQNNTENEKSG